MTLRILPSFNKLSLSLVYSTVLIPVQWAWKLSPSAGHHCQNDIQIMFDFYSPKTNFAIFVSLQVITIIFNYF